MTRRRLIRTTVVAGMMLTVLASSGALADRYYFKDVLRPGGQARSRAVEYADWRACGADADGNFKNAAKFKACMRTHGWAVDKYTPDRSRARPRAHKARARATTPTSTTKEWRVTTPAASASASRRTGP